VKHGDPFSGRSVADRSWVIAIIGPGGAGQSGSGGAGITVHQLRRCGRQLPALPRAEKSPSRRCYAWGSKAAKTNPLECIDPGSKTDNDRSKPIPQKIDTEISARDRRPAFAMRVVEAGQ